MLAKFLASGPLFSTLVPLGTKPQLEAASSADQTVPTASSFGANSGPGRLWDAPAAPEEAYPMPVPPTRPAATMTAAGTAGGAGWLAQYSAPSAVSAPAYPHPSQPAQMHQQPAATQRLPQAASMQQPAVSAQSTGPQTGSARPDLLSMLRNNQQPQAPAPAAASAAPTKLEDLERLFP